jgi:hypothetical protein
MPSDVAMLIADPRRRLVVASHYIGGNHVAYSVRTILRREPDYTTRGFESWGKIMADEMLEILQLRYEGGLSPEMLAELVLRFPPEQYLWCITRDY